MLLAALVVTFGIGYSPTNKFFFFLRRICLPSYIEYFSYKEAVIFLGSSNTLGLIFLYLLKPILVFSLLKNCSFAEIYFWIFGLMLILGITTSKDIMKFRGTVMVIFYLMLLQVSFAGTILAIYIFTIVFYRSQIKASLVSTVFVMTLSVYYLAIWEVIVFCLPAVIFICHNYGLLKYNSFNLLTFFTHKNNI